MGEMMFVFVCCFVDCVVIVIEDEFVVVVF